MNQKLIDNVKQGMVVISLGAIVSLIPFYFQISAMTKGNQQINNEQATLIEKNSNGLQELQVKGAIDNTEIKLIKESLDRIEKKIDRLNEKDTK